MASLVDPATLATQSVFTPMGDIKPATVENPVATPVDAATTTGPSQLLNPATATELFGHVASPADAANTLTPRKVKTTTIRNDTGPLLDQLTAAADVNHRKDAIVRNATDLSMQEAGLAGLTGANQFAYILATTERESRIGTMMTEGAPKGKDAETYFENKYGPGSRKAAELGNTQEGDGYTYRGRGLVQTTGRGHYDTWTKRLANEGFLHNGAAPDLVNNPALAAEPDIAARMMAEGMRDGSFTTRKLGSYVNENLTDYYNARRVINGTDHAQEIADRATIFEGIINQNSNAFHGAMMEAKLKNLPTAHGPVTLGGNPTAVTPELLNPNLMGETPGHFVPLADMVKQPIGKFALAPTPIPLPRPRPERPEDQPANVPIPLPRPRP